MTCIWIALSLWGYSGTSVFWLHISSLLLIVYFSSCYIPGIFSTVSLMSWCYLAVAWPGVTLRDAEDIGKGRGKLGIEPADRTAAHAVIVSEEASYDWIPTNNYWSCDWTAQVFSFSSVCQRPQHAASVSSASLLIMMDDYIRVLSLSLDYLIALTPLRPHLYAQRILVFIPTFISHDKCSLFYWTFKI